MGDHRCGRCIGLAHEDGGAVVAAFSWTQWVLPYLTLSLDIGNPTRMA
jgi:hypothetical protein